MHRWQITGALSIASLAAPWHARRDALQLLLAAADDWSSAAAILGFAACAELDPELRAPVLAIFVELAQAEHASRKPSARALAIAGMRLAEGAARTLFIRLRVALLTERTRSQR